MGIYRAYTKESRPEPARKATTSEYQTESDSLVGCKVEQLSDSIRFSTIASPVGWVERQRNPTNNTPKKAKFLNYKN
ncbi:hypothetical protein H6G74_22570 [Nostoc spongiaeforme FACHB-130]|uniref:Uncharacterized protein n=1 Tax=Nostoc spongiaeforme FACHB-130 TaxID=1357510 RepID=A0ABR8G1K5_9NOSO|nr:hypothetical protein [Nostoc spongiaeforme]MBD2597088.1 hypothetical protein [Nostoc spongiaeforme FACHB-130]